MTTKSVIVTLEQLVPIFDSKIGEDITQVCDARALHAYLEVGRDFSSWLKERIGKYGFEENQDYVQVVDSSVPQNGGTLESTSYGKSKIDYHLTIGMAKELAMVENNAKGREVRRYFIKMEKLALHVASHTATIQQGSINRASLRTFAKTAQASAIAINAMANAALALATKYETNPAPAAQPLPAKSVIQSPISTREQAFIHAWWECFGNKTVTASDLYRAITTKQCQILNDSSGALLGDIELWTPKKLSYALRRWSELTLDSYKIQNIGKTSHGITWRLELLAA